MHTIARFSPDPRQRFILAAVIAVGMAGALASIAGSLGLARSHDFSDVCFLPPPLDSAGVAAIILMDEVARLARPTRS